MRKVTCASCGRPYDYDSDDFCPKCGSYMVEKGNKLVCANEQCGFVMPMKENKEEKED